jgi:hypothetical protein
MLIILPAGDDVAGARAGTNEARRTPRVRAQVQAGNQLSPRVEPSASVSAPESLLTQASRRKCEDEYRVKKRPRATKRRGVHETKMRRQT